jgi:hypothetical protein
LWRVCVALQALVASVSETSNMKFGGCLSFALRK